MPPEIITPPKTKLNMEQPLSDLARQVGSELRAAPIFRFGNTIAAANEAGEIAPMTPARFVTWVGKYIIFTRFKKEERRAVEIRTDVARLILACDGFRSQLQVMNTLSEELEDVSEARPSA